MEAQRRAATRIVGYEVRTTNAAEADPDTSRLPALWRKATQPGAFDAVARPINAPRLVAVLYDYESDENGAYTEIVGVEVALDDNEAPKGMTNLLVPEVDSVEFTAHGAMPKAILETWQEIWDAFPSGDLSRAFTFDVEFHPGEATVADVFISVRGR